MPGISMHPITSLLSKTAMMKGVHVMKKLVSCLLVVMMLFTVAGAFAEPTGMGRFGQANILSRFVKGTDPQTQDIALQVESGNEASDLVIRVDGDNLHLVSRNNAVEDSHVQLNPTGIYVSADGTVSLLRYATVTAAMQKIDDATNYETLREVEDTCRALIMSYTADKLRYETYSESDNPERLEWAEQAKIRANSTAAKYNEYYLKNSFVWKDNIPDDIATELSYIP